MISCQIYIRQVDDDMYSDINNWLCIHDTRTTDNKLISPVCKIEKNQISTLSFKVHPDSPAYSILTPENATRCEVWVCERTILEHEPEYSLNVYPVHRWIKEGPAGDGFVWRYDLFVGHVVENTPYFASNGLIEANIMCVDHMDYLTKGILPREQYNLQDAPPGYTENGHNAWFEYFIDRYNQERGYTTAMFGRDNISVMIDKGNHTNGYNYIIDFENTYEALTERFVNKWGGVFYTDLTVYCKQDEDLGIIYPDDIMGVAWVSDSKYGRHQNVPIEKGVNLKSLTITTDTSEFCTRVYPVGALQEDGTRITIKGVTKDGHDPNTEYIDISNTEYIAQHGVTAVVQEWSDVNNNGILYDRGKEWLSNSNRIRKSYDAEALDLSVIGNPENRFRCGDYHRIIQPDMNVDEELQIIRIEYDLAQLQNVQITFGDKIVNASEQRKNTIVKNKEKFESITQILGGG